MHSSRCDMVTHTLYYTYNYNIVTIYLSNKYHIDYRHINIFMSMIFDKYIILEVIYQRKPPNYSRIVGYRTCCIYLPVQLIEVIELTHII